MITIQQSLKTSINKLKLSNIHSSVLDAEVLLLEALNKDKTWLYINNKYILNKAEEELFNDFIRQRLENKPVAYIINKKEFYGYDFYVNENVLIPRPETELIVEEVLKVLNNTNGNGHPCGCPSPTVLIDIGTGSGCIAISILNELVKNKSESRIKNIFLNDISKEAIKIAKINSKKYNLDKKIKFIKADLKKFLDNLNKKDIYNSNQIIITANLPYIKNNSYKTLSLDIKKYEPKIALTAEKNGLDYIKKLINSISKIQLKLTQEIYLFIEADPDQMSEIITISRKKFGSVDFEIIKDLSGRERLIKFKQI